MPSVKARKIRERAEGGTPPSVEGGHKESCPDVAMGAVGWLSETKVEVLGRQLDVLA